MKKGKNKIAYQNKDVAAKVTGEALEGQSLAVFGLPDVKIVKALPTNLPVIESNELRLDQLFLMDDGSVGIIDYESQYSVENFVKYINYAARVIRRYDRKKQPRKLSRLKIIVIYTADVETAPLVYDLGGITVRIEAVFLVNLDTQDIYERLSEKIMRGEKLDGEDCIRMMTLPLTVKGKEAKQDVILKTVALTREMKDHRQTVEVLAGLLTFTDKIIEESSRQRIEEEIEMTQIGKMIFDKGLKEGIDQGITQGISQGISQGITQGITQGADRKLIGQCCRKLRKGKTPVQIAEDLEESFEVIQEICQAAKPFAPGYGEEHVYQTWIKNRQS